MDPVPDEQIATHTSSRQPRGVGAWPVLFLLGTLASGCGIRAAFEQLDRDGDGVMLGEDCDEDDPTIGSEPLYADQDGDGHGVPPQIGVGCAGEPGTALVADDCDDGNTHVWQEAVWYLDNDRDGYGVEPGVELCASEAVGYALVAGDCLDDDPGAYPGAPTSCDGDDNDCDGAVDPDCELPWGTMSATDADWVLQGAGDAQLGVSVAAAGDVDCDGLDDALVGAPGAEDGDGAVILAYGSDEALRWTLGAESARLAVLTGPTGEGGFGASVAGDADFDGDGCADLVIGAPWTSDGGVIGRGMEPGGGWGSGERNGKVFVAMGPHFAPTAEAEDAWGVEELSGGRGGELGTALSCGQDVFGDGAFDCLVSAPSLTSDVGGKEAGAVYLLSPPGLSGSSPEEASTLVVEGSSKAERLGSALAMGDLNADGMADLALGASTDWVEAGASGTHATKIGRIYLVFDVPSGGYDAEGLADTWIEGTAADGTGLAVAMAGDLDDDGYDDVVVGAPLWDAAEGNEGRLLVYPGDGVISAESTLTEADASATLVGTEAGGELGASVALLADMSGDDRAELLVGTPGADGTRGAALLFIDALSGTVAPDAAWLRVEGSATGDEVGRSVAGVDVNGLGREDLLIGASLDLTTADRLSGAGYASLVFTDAF